jgi:UDP-glucose:(heptosyl)LPS alpha-1,3-glucosyltransferase
MKIGLVRRGFSASGGAEAYLLRLADGLAKRGHQPALVTSGEWPKQAWPYGEMLCLPGATPTAFATAFGRVAPQFDVTLSLDRTPGCDVFRAGDGVHAAWLKRRAAWEPAWRGFLRRWSPKHGALLLLERRVFASCQHIIANSKMVADEIREWHGVPAHRIHIIPNGIATGVAKGDRSAARARFGIPDDTLCVLFVGTGWERKGLADAVTAIDALDGNAILLVAGKGPAPRFASKHTKFLGPTRDLSAVFAAADVFTLPTRYDPFSNACLEALAAGLPVITTTANGCGEILDAQTGSTVEPGDPTALAAAIAQWKNADPVKSSTACQALAARHSIDENVTRTLQVLEAARKSHGN